MRANNLVLVAPKSKPTFNMEYESLKFETKAKPWLSMLLPTIALCMVRTTLVGQFSLPSCQMQVASVQVSGYLPVSARTGDTMCCDLP
eukprot:1027476-Amphidinium_carterae.1